MLELELTDSTTTSINQGGLEDHLKDMLRRLNTVGTLDIPGGRQAGHTITKTPYVMEINLVGDKEIQALNAQYLGNNQPTDVLSFENPEAIAENGNYLGSLVISSETAQVQAGEAGISLQDEVEMLAGHGLLHLLGYHHN